MDLAARLRDFGSKAKMGKVKEQLNIDPIEAAKVRIKNKLADDVKYRTSILATVKTLAALEPEDMRFACESMEEQRYAKGEDIIRQGERGDSLYLLQHGSVVITRKVNHRDPNEEPTVLVRLPKNTHFGEIALLTDEPRSATVTALEDCVCAVMKKNRFDDIVAASNAKQARHRYNVGRSVLSVVPTFSKFSSAYKDVVLEVMQPLSFPPGSYICKEGAMASSFFVMLEGHVKCTVQDPAGNPGDEKEIGRLGPGSYFGEASLLDPSNTRNCNIVSVGDVSCMVLQRTDFATIYRGLKKDEEERAKSMIKKKVVSHGGGGKAGKRKVTAFAKAAKASDEPHPELVKTIVCRMARFITESTWINQYSKMYRSMLLDNSKIEDYGKLAWELMLPTIGPKPARAEAIETIIQHCLKISKIPPKDRSFTEQAFICGMLRQTNNLKKELCLGWHPFQYTELCKNSWIQEFKPLDLIQDVGVHSTRMYLVIRGCVRVWRGTSRTDLKHEEDLVPGEYFGEAAMFGNHTSLISARAISSVHVAVFEDRDFTNAANNNANIMTKEARQDFIRSLPLFKRIDATRAAELAAALEQISIPKRALITRKGDTHPDLCFILSGYAEISVLKTSPPYPSAPHISVVLEESDYTPVARIDPGELYGESGFVSNSLPSSTPQQQQAAVGLDYEHHDAVAAMQMEVLVLKPKHFHLIDRFIRPIIVNGYRSKVQWRGERIGNLKKERSQLRQVRKSMSSAFHTAPDVSSAARSESLGAARSNRRSFSPSSRPGTVGASRGLMGEPSQLSLSNQGLVKRTNMLPSLGRGQSMSGLSTETVGAAMSSTSIAAAASTTGTGTGTSGGSDEYDFLGNLDLDDVPRLLDGEFDPFMVIEAQKTQREMARQTRNMRYIRLPKTSRGRGRTVDTEKEPGFVAVAILSNPANNTYSRPSTGAGLASAVGRYRSHINSRGGARSRQGGSRGGGGGVQSQSSQNNYSGTSVYTSFASHPTAAEGTNATAGDFLLGEPIPVDIDALMRPSSGYLAGSSRIPNTLSYIDSAEAHSPIASPTHSRPNSRK